MPTESKPVKFSDAERAAMRERAKELKAQANKADGEQAVLAKLAELKGLDRTLGEKVHQIIKANAPMLSAKTWYGMPAYANQDGKVVCFFQDAAKFGARYATLGFNDAARIDDGDMWPVTFALKDLSPAVEKTIADLVKKAVS